MNIIHKSFEIPHNTCYSTLRTLRLLRIHRHSEEMAQGIKVIAAKSNDLCLIPGTRMVKAETRLPQAVLCPTHACCGTHMYTHACICAFIHVNKM